MRHTKKKRLKTLLIEGYKEMADESIKITREFEALDDKATKEIPRLSKKALELIEDAYWVKAANSRERTLIRKGAKTKISPKLQTKLSW